MNKWTPASIILVGTILVSAVWFIYGANTKKLNLETKEWEYRDVGKWGQFGDKFGALNALFTGIGLVGVTAGLWLQHLDQERAKKEGIIRDRREERAIVTAIFDEFEIGWENYQGVIASMEKEKKEEVLTFRIDRPLSVFPIYHANAASIGKIRSDVLRRELIRGYNASLAMITMIVANRPIIEALDLAIYQVNMGPTDQAVSWRDFKRSIAVDHTTALRAQHARVLEIGPELIKSMRGHREVLKLEAKWEGTV